MEKAAGLRLKDFRVAAVDGRPLLYAPDMTFHHGVTALVGPNGAGKSTFLRALATLHPVESGSIILDTPAQDRRAILDNLIFLPQNFASYPDMTGQEVLEYYLQLRGAGRKQARSVATAWLEAVGLVQARNARTGTYSQGMLQRLGFAYAMQVDVRLYLLDEPFAGVDPETREALTDLLFSFCGDRTVIVCTHHVDEMVSRGAAIARVSNGTLAYE